MLERIVWIVAGALVLVAGFFFLAAALVAGLLVAAVIAVRLWWMRRRLRREADAEFISTEYRVVEREALPADAQVRDAEPQDRSDSGAAPDRRTGS